ncbi:CBO0543 family protein [Bacillus suaedaesalsae]|uniref:Acyltransferase 3 domain-containing protein n=1 Tax=Bacillus suaedaesalsae TaxID=2810349 RepID=A0ABS2DM92_9BACI|nr:CBO0543 family protein [Bacillus suaedaesalsae]MBM6619598.1 hypothetical protein [Bacillus suaedaesalsae]
MYLLLVLIVYVFLGYYFVDWKNWKDYYPTVQFYIICNLFYNFIFYNHTLWRYNGITFSWLNHTFIEISFMLFVIPVILMIYLRYFPKKKKPYLYVAVWVAYFTSLEFIFHNKGMFIYENDWNLFWSGIFNVIMFTILRIHYRNPLVGIIVSIPVITILFLFFHPTLAELK